MNDMVKSSGHQVQHFSLQPTTFEEATRLAELMANSDLVPKDYRGKPGNVLIAVQMGAEVGLAAMQAIQNIAVINGRPSMWGDAAIALVRSHKVCEYIKEEFDQQTMTATCRSKRRGSEQEHVTTFSKEDAVLADLWNKPGPWKQYPKRMLQMRSRSWNLRDNFADVLKGLAIAEEAQDFTAIDAEVNKPAKRSVSLSDITGGPNKDEAVDAEYVEEQPATKDEPPTPPNEEPPTPPEEEKPAPPEDEPVEDRPGPERPPALIEEVVQGIRKAETIHALKSWGEEAATLEDEDHKTQARKEYKRKMLELEAGQHGIDLTKGVDDER